MAHQIQVSTKKGIRDSLGEQVRRSILRDLGIEVDYVETIKVYTIDTPDSVVASSLETLTKELFPDPILNNSSNINSPDDQLAAMNELKWNNIIEVGNRPGVVDNEGKTSKKAIEDMLGVKFGEDEHVYTSAQFLIGGDLPKEDVERIATYLHNTLIHTAHTKTREQFLKDGGMNIPVPRVDLPPQTYVDPVVEMQILDEKGEIIPDDNVDWKIIETMGKKGIFDERKTIELRKKGQLKEDENFYRGPLALSRDYAEAIRNYFKALGRTPTDIEVEAVAQTWSEHCKHTIFAAEMDGEMPLYKQIQRSTQITREMRGENDRCVSVFTDNSGVIRFDDIYDICYKIETHNSPSALDPYGGSITGIVGVNRDPMGTGIGAKLLINTYGFCFGDPNSENMYYDHKILFKDRKRTQRLLHPRTVFEGVRRGVEHGGNKSGIPTSWGFLTFHPGYSGKPLVFVGTVGIMPHELNLPGREEPVKTADKSAKPGYYIVMAGNRVGVDGVHGATFSSEVMGEGSPATAVQIGDPITQKRLHDAQYEAMLKGFYSAVTDNGAGGLSCSVPEICDSLDLGCIVNLEKVPLKYKGINPNEVWISESQERMTYLVAPEKIEEFLEFMKSRDVEATVIGVATEDRRCIVKHTEFNKSNGAIDDEGTIMDIDMEFLHRGLPKGKLSSTYTPELYMHAEPGLDKRSQGLERITDAFYSMLGRLNICSKEYVVRQFDHEVQGASAIKPLVGVKQDVHSDASVTRPLLLYKPDGDPIHDSKKGIVLSHGILPRYSFIDTEHMARAAFDTAIRNAVAVGADPDQLYALDNFCWCSSNEPERLGQLKKAVKGATDASITSGVSFISGKDSMFNDFKGYLERAPAEGPDDPIKISVPPTLLISAIGVVDNVEDCVTMDAKFAGDLVYVLGETKDELGGSEYLAMIGEKEIGRNREYIGENVPRTNIRENMNLYRAVHSAIKEGIVASCKSVNKGGLAAALGEVSMGGELGLDVDLSKVIRSADLNEASAADKILFSQSTGRMIITISPQYREQFEKKMEGQKYSCIGEVTLDQGIKIKGLEGSLVVDADVSSSKKVYKATLDWGYQQEREAA